MLLRPELQAVLDATRAAQQRLRAAIALMARQASAINFDLASEVVWPSGHRPDWWGDLALRKFVTDSHRQMTIIQCCAEVERRFNRPFSRSTLQRYWALLDKALAEQSSKREAA